MLHPAYPIETERLMLRPYTEDDFEAFYGMQSRSDIVRYLYWGVRTADEVREVFETKVTQRTAIEHEGEGLQLAVELRDSGVVAGDVVLVWVSEEHQIGRDRIRLPPRSPGQRLRNGGVPRDAAARLRRAGLAPHRGPV